MLRKAPPETDARQTPLILVGHSMGGLVIKKAFVLARQLEEFESIASRVKAIFFMATPHRGSDLAQILSKVLAVAPGARPFVNDLNRNSIATQSINDEFPHHCHDLQLYSFYETVPTNYFFGKGLIVDKDLATLGYSNERTAYLNANHREVVKFSSVDDPNYLTVRNSLAFAINSLIKESSLRHRKVDNDARRRLDYVLGVSSPPEDDLLRVNTMRMEGSSQWIFGRAEFQQWSSGPANQIYWVNAQPAAGKSVLAGAIISHLRSLSCECSYFFFDHGDKLSSTIGYLLRSIIWQMASVNADILRMVLEKCEEDEHLTKMDHRTIWRRYFLEGLLKIRLSGPQYWIIDALDECGADSELVPLLLKVSEISSIRIFITCRSAFDAYRQIKQPKVAITSHTLSLEDTQKDIELYLRANVELLHLIDEEARNTIISQVLSKSAGCFLWVNLVLQELRQVHTSSERRQVLEEVPSGMDELYSRILDSMSKATYGNKLAKAILTWTVCSVTPLTIEELHLALEIDMQDAIDNMGNSILSGCGHLVFVDAQSHVQMIHQTARDYLLRPFGPSEFSIDRKAGHKRLLMTCLRYLLDELRGPRPRKLSIDQGQSDCSSFVRYACSSLASHVTHVDSADDECLVKLAQFLSSYNVLSWIEYIAQNLDLGIMVQTGKALKDYLHRRSKHKSLLGKEVAIVDAWSTDLRRLVTKFGKHLSSLPTSIYQLIPSLCPKDSAIKKQFSSYTRGFTVEGLSTEGWDDCLATLKYQQDTPIALATSQRFFAVGFLTGSVRIYGTTTCQEIRALTHGESLKILTFGDLGNILVSTGLKSISMWNVGTWEKIWTFNLPAQCLSMVVEDHERLMIGVLKNNNLIYWDLTTGQIIRSIDWTHDFAGQSSYAIRRPTVAAFGLELNLLAIVYRGQDILLWDMESSSLYDLYSKEGVRSGRDNGNATVWSVVFSPAPGTALLAAGYSDGDLVLFDVSMGIVKEMALANAQTLTCSSDGYTLASADSSGTIQVFDFETLKQLYRITSVEEFSIRSLAFSADGQRLFDLRGSVCRVWDPIVLSRHDISDENSDTVSISTMPYEAKLDDSEDVPMVTALCYPGDGDIFFVGKDDGSVSSYDAKNGRVLQYLFQHAGNASIVLLHLEQLGNILSTVDSSSRMTAHRIVPKHPSYEVSKTIIDYRTGAAVDQLLANKDNSRLLVSSGTGDKLWSISNDDARVVKTTAWTDRRQYAWKQHPTNPTQLILIIDTVLHIYDWHELERLTSDEGILLEGSILPELAIKYIMPCFDGNVIATAFVESLSPRSKSRVLMWNTTDLSPGSNRAAPIPSYQPLADQVECLIGAYKDRLVFLHSSGWICSANSSSFDLTSYVRHFFIPTDWLSNSIDLLINVTVRGTILFAKGNEVAVIKKGLDINFQSSSAPLGHRPSVVPRKSSSSSSPFRGRLTLGSHRNSN
ncbi:MAG: hypothetical protein LQ351_000556 [Letrouitia transgressa]|nr:MAG: hypothetical protein LQ351_000556 [Letrouitia transgressa]